MNFFYENKLGSIHFKGGGTKKDGVYVKEISGLGLPEKECNVAIYVSQAGQEVISERDIERIITLSVDVYSKKSVQSMVRRLFDVLYQPGTLAVVAGSMHRKIACRCTGIEQAQRQGREIRSLVLQFTCDCPYFTDDEEQKAALFLRRDLINGSFVLPCIFTERISRTMVVNQGTISTEPVLKIYSTGGDAEQVDLGDSGMTIVNHTTGRKITFNYNLLPGEILTVDIPARNIISNISGSVPGALSEDSFLSDFYLCPGANDVEVISYNAGKELAVSVTYKNQYVEAVV